MYEITANRKAFLDTIAFSEIGPALLAQSDNGYNILVGSRPGKPLLFSSYATHPQILNSTLHSTAAGRYQLLGRYFQPYATQLGLKDFSPASQDQIALQQIKERGALVDIDAGNFASSVEKCSNIWASFPGNTYGQHENNIDVLQAAFVRVGGTLA